MPVYLVHRVLPGLTVEARNDRRAVVQRACSARSRDGEPVRYLRSIFTPGESRCQCLFEAANADLVQAANDTAQLPYRRIVVAMEIGPNE